MSARWEGLGPSVRKCPRKKASLCFRLSKVSLSGLGRPRWANAWAPTVWNGTFWKCPGPLGKLGGKRQKAHTLWLTSPPLQAAGAPAPHLPTRRDCCLGMMPAQSAQHFLFQRGNPKTCPYRRRRPSGQWGWGGSAWPFPLSLWPPPAASRMTVLQGSAE